MAQLVACLSAIIMKPRVVLQGCQPSTWEVKAGMLSHLWLPRGRTTGDLVSEMGEGKEQGRGGGGQGRKNL